MKRSTEKSCTSKLREVEDNIRVLNFFKNILRTLCYEVILGPELEIRVEPQTQVQFLVIEITAIQLDLY